MEMGDTVSVKNESLCSGNYIGVDADNGKVGLSTSRDNKTNYSGKWYFGIINSTLIYQKRRV